MLASGQSTQIMGIGYTTDPHLYLALRLITVALSVGACIIVFGAVNLVTKRWWAAATAGLLLAVSPLMVLNGVYITPDTYWAFFTRPLASWLPSGCFVAGVALTT